VRPAERDRTAARLAYACSRYAHLDIADGEDDDDVDRKRMERGALRTLLP
jgi:hypothetical protein